MTANLWSKPESLTDFRAWYRGLAYNFAGVLRYSGDK